MKQSAEKKAAAKQYENDIAARNEQREYDRGALLRLVEDAEGAGFNPLTVLRNGGTSYQNSGAPLLSRREVGGSPVGDALGNVANFLENFDPHADTKREQSYRLVESQIASLNAGTLSRAPGSVARSARRSYGTSDYERRPSGKSGALSGARMSSGNGWLDPPSDEAEGMPIWVKGTDRDGKSVWIPNPDGPDAEQLLFAALTRAQSGAEAFARTAWGVASRPWERVKVSKVPKGQRGNEGTWWDYVPSISARWK